MFQVHLLLLIGLTLKLAVAEALENTTANKEEESTTTPRSGVISGIVGGIVEPLNFLLPPKAKEAIVSPVKNVTDALDSNLKAIYPGKLCI
jgi:hypothetical protein